MAGSIRLHPKHGLAHFIPGCFYCGNLSDEIVIAGAAWRGDEPPPNGMVVSTQPCRACEELMKTAVILIEITDEKEMNSVAVAHEAHQRDHGHKPEAQRPPFIPQPSRTGAFAAVSRAFIERAINPGEMRDSMLRNGWTFLDPKSWDALRLPRGCVVELRANDGDLCERVPFPGWLETNSALVKTLDFQHKQGTPDSKMALVDMVVLLTDGRSLCKTFMRDTEAMEFIRETPFMHARTATWFGKEVTLGARFYGV